MNFYNIVNKTLNESEQDLLHPLYIAYVQYNTDKVTIRSYDEQDEEYVLWNSNYSDYHLGICITTKDFEQALAVFLQVFSVTSQSNVMPISSAVVDQLSKHTVNQIRQAIGHYPGTWKVVDDVSNSNALMIGVQFDVDSHKASSHAAQELLGF
jgi:hypothetical protein